MTATPIPGSHVLFCPLCKVEVHRTAGDDPRAGTDEHMDEIEMACTDHLAEHHPHRYTAYRLTGWRWLVSGAGGSLAPCGPTVSVWRLPLIALLYALVYWGLPALYAIMGAEMLLGLATDGQLGLKIGLGLAGLALAFFQLGLKIGETGYPPR